MSLTASIIDFLQHAGALIAYLIIFLIIFTESGILIGFFLPGDTLLLTLGFLCYQGIFNFPLVLLVTAAGAILGNSFGYAFGRKVGPALFTREDSSLFKKKNLQRAHRFYEKYGAVTIVLARFVPFARTFAPILAGMSGMSYRVFLNYTIIGGLIWVVLVTSLGYFLGQAFPDLDRYILYFVVGIALVSFIPAYLEYRRHRHDKDE